MLSVQPMPEPAMTSVSYAASRIAISCSILLGSAVAVAAPSIETIEPDEIESAVGGFIIMAGTGFGADASVIGSPRPGQVLWGSGTCDIIFWSDTEIECIAPRGAGTVNVRVVDGLDDPSIESPYAYVPRRKPRCA
ncbi:MAG: hypothetical protein ACI82G_002276 [Bradymonadia bacterium]|jgi:hypothetical protein